MTSGTTSTSAVSFFSDTSTLYHRTAKKKCCASSALGMSGLMLQRLLGPLAMIVGVREFLDAFLMTFVPVGSR
jgi:hypothetical protein